MSVGGTGERRAGWGRALVGIILTVAAGCGEKEPRADDPPVTPTLPPPASVSPSTDPAAAGAQAAVTAYRGMWDAFVEASNNGDVAPPSLATYTSGRALTKLNNGLALNKSRGQNTKGKPTLSPKITAIGPVAAPTSVSIADCFDDSRWLLYKKDGQLADDVPGGRRQTIAKVEKAGDVWKVTTLALQGTGTC
jgi:hypothetical protein